MTVTTELGRSRWRRCSSQEFPLRGSSFKVSGDLPI